MSKKDFFFVLLGLDPVEGMMPTYLRGGSSLS